MAGNIAISISRALQRSRAKPCFFIQMRKRTCQLRCNLFSAQDERQQSDLKQEDENISGAEQEYLNKNSENILTALSFKYTL